jgi:hypothetical protein
MGSLRSQLALLCASAVALIAIAPALAEDPPPPTPPATPSIDQYVETVPTSNGGVSPGVGKPRTKSLPHRVSARLHARPDAVTKRLEAIATSSVYGAPQRDLSPPRGSATQRTAPANSSAGPKAANPKAANPKAANPKAANPLSAAVSAVSDSGDSHVFWLVAALIVVTTTMVWASARRHHHFG